MWLETCRPGSLCVRDEAIFCFYGLTQWRFLRVALRRLHLSGCEWPHCVNHQRSGCAVIAPRAFQLDPRGQRAPCPPPNLSLTVVAVALLLFDWQTSGRLAASKKPRQQQKKQKTRSAAWQFDLTEPLQTEYPPPPHPPPLPWHYIKLTSQKVVNKKGEIRWMSTPQDEFPCEMTIKNKCLRAQQAGTCAWRGGGGGLIEVGSCYFGTWCFPSADSRYRCMVTTLLTVSYKPWIKQQNYTDWPLY